MNAAMYEKADMFFGSTQNMLNVMVFFQKFGHFLKDYLKNVQQKIMQFPQEEQILF